MADAQTTSLLGPWLSASVFIPLAAAAVATFPRARQHARAIGVFGCSASLLISLEALREVAAANWAALTEPWSPTLFSADAGGAATMVLFAALALVSLVSTPKRAIHWKVVASILLLTGGASAAYGADNLTVFLAAWIVGLLPFATRAMRAADKLSVFELAASTGFLALGVILHAIGSHSSYAFASLVLAAVLRTGLFPFHRIAIGRFEAGPLGLVGLLLNAHLGAFLILRFGIPLFPEQAGTALPWLCALALATAIYTAILGLAERDTRRILALVLVSQTSAIFAGLVSGRPEGAMGGLLQWIVLGVASTVMLSICASIEARIHQPWARDGLLGLAAQMPRLAIFFAVSALSLVGLPGTLGFPGEDLLIHGALAAHPLIGMLLPAAIAVNAYQLYRLYSQLFLGPAVPSWAAAPDAVPRERWAFSICIVILIWGGLMPSQIVALRSAAADILTTVTFTATAEGGPP